MKKAVWVTSLVKETDADKQRVAGVMQGLKKYGLDVHGHFWTDSVDKLPWQESIGEIKRLNASAWIVISSKEEFAKESVRYGLSAMSAGIHAMLGHDFPTVILSQEAANPKPEELPHPLRGVTFVSDKGGAWQAKVVAIANKGFKGEKPADYRFDIFGDAKLGQWFELGPVSGKWSGVIFGVTGGGAEINFQAVGNIGQLPEKTILNYAQQGMKIKLGDTEYTAWALRNEVAENQSYYARVKGSPSSVIFGAFSESDDAELYTLRLI